MPLILPQTPLDIVPSQISLQGSITLSFLLDSTQQTRAIIRYFLVEPSIVLIDGVTRSSQIIDVSTAVPVNVVKVLDLDNEPSSTSLFHGLLRLHVEFQEVDNQDNPIGPSRRRSTRIIIT